MRQAPPPATRSRTSHCATAARRRRGPARAAMPAAAALFKAHIRLTDQYFQVSRFDDMQWRCCQQAAAVTSSSNV
jgi:hypothetical protein